MPKIGRPGQGEVETVCASCGKRFKDWGSNRRKYCGQRCAGQAIRRDRPKCEVCGKPVRTMRNRFCSRACRGVAQRGVLIGVNSYPALYARVQKAHPDPEPCAICGSAGKHRHHPDYSKPLDIVWLCAGCHQRLHSVGKPRRTRVRPKSIHLPGERKRVGEERRTEQQRKRSEYLKAYQAKRKGGRGGCA